VQVRHAAARSDAPPRHRLKVVRRRALKVIATGVVATMLAAFVAVGERAWQLKNNMHVLKIEEFIDEAIRPVKRAPTAEAAPLDPFGGQAVNILIVGIDTREGANAAIAEDSMDSQLNDVNMIAHISADRSRVDMIAIPRDTLVPLPACQQPSGQISGAQSETMINEAFAKGTAYNLDSKDAGMACTVLAVEQITDIPLDGFVLVDFAGFANVVDALGGVDICVPDGLIGTKTHISLEPGLHHLEGQPALQFARTRMGKDFNGNWLDGSDLVRINRQQQLVATVINEILSSGDLASLPKLNKTATAITRSLYVSESLSSVTGLAGLAFALRDIKMSNVSLFMAPVTPAGARVRLSEWGDQSKFGGLSAKEIFELFAVDSPIPGTVPYKLANPESGAVPPTDGATPDPGTSAGGTGEPVADEDFVTPETAPVAATCEVVGQGTTG
jgi:LCP family protein required for cell wall assembly